MKNPKPTVRVVSATEAKNKFGEMIKHAYSGAEHLIIEKSGIPVVVIIPVTDYEQLVKATSESKSSDSELAQASRMQSAQQEMRDFLARVHAYRPDVSEEEGDRDIERAIRSVRAKK